MSIISKEQHSLQRWSHVCCKKILKLNCSPLQFKMSEVEVCHLWAPSKPALQESISSLTSTALHDKGGPQWRRLENEVRTVSAREDTVTLLTSSGKQGGCVKTDLRTPGLGGILWSQVVSCQNKLIFFSCELRIISRQIHANWTLSASARCGRCTHCLFVADLKLTGV